MLIGLLVMAAGAALTGWMVYLPGSGIAQMLVAGVGGYVMAAGLGIAFGKYIFKAVDALMDAIF
jgi:hypothetical protein